MPDLSQLPDPTKDMFGGMTSPTALMTMGDKQVNDLLNPKPLFEQNVKLSSQAQQTLNGIAQQQQALATETDRMAEQVRRQQQEAVEAQIKESQNQVKENERRTQELLKAQEEARKKKAEEQGGKLGAGADGSFVLRQHAEELIKKSEWQRIVSNLRRDDEMEMWLKQAETKLREAGVTDEAVIKAELDVARNVISGDTKSYTQRMKEDNIDPLDLVSSLGKGARTIYRGAGILFGASDEWAKSEQDAINSINSTYSDTMLLDQANYAYQRSKTKAQNPDEGLIDGFVSGVKDAWNSGNIISSVVDTAGYVPYAVVGTAFAAKGIAAAGAATGLTGLTALATGKTAAVSSIGGRIVSGILSAETAGAAVTSGLLSATDAASGAYDSVMALDFNDKTQLAKARQTYINEYGQANWDNLVADNGGDMNKVKSELAIQAGRSAGSKAFVTTAPLGVFGLEATLAKMGTQGLATQAGKRVLTIGANTVSETLEEGFTQLSQNMGAKPVTGVSLTDDVGATAAMGAIAGGGMSAGSQAVAAAMDARSAYLKPTFDANELDINRWVSAGNINYDAYRTTVGHQMDNLARDGRRTKLSEDDIQQMQQRTFNEVVDNNEIWSRMTPEQQKEFKDYLRLSYNINSNGYARYQETDVSKAWASNDYAQINNVIVDNPLSADLLNAYRVKNNVELEQVPQKGREYFKTLADVLDTMATQDTNVTTQEREVQSMKIIVDKVKGNDKLTDLEKRGVTAFMINYMDAGSRRMTDEQQAAYDRVQQAARQVQANQQVNQNGTQEQNQTSASQPAGQGTVAENAGTVAPQGSTNGAGTSDTLGTIATELATVEPTGQGSNNAQSVGNDPVQQTPVASNQADNTATSGTSTSGNGQGLGQTPSVGNTQSATTPTSNSGQITQQGIAGQTSQTRQSVGQTGPSTTQTPVSGGSVGTTPSERNTNGGSQQTITQADVTDSFLADPANETYVKSFINVAYNDLGKFGQGVTKHKADLRRLAGITGVEGGKLSDEHIDKLYDLINMPTAERTTLINNEFRTQAATNRVHNAIHHLKQNTIKAIKADIKAQEQARRSAERNAEQQVAQQAIQQEREQVAEQKRIEKQERDKQALIDKTEVAFEKADNAATVKEQAAQKANELLADLTDQRQAIQDELSQAKTNQKATTTALKEATTAYNKAVNEVTKAKTAEKRELSKEKRKGLRLGWLSRVGERNEAKTAMNQAKQDVAVADKAVSTATAKLATINVKIKEAQLKAKADDEAAKLARASADKIFDKLSGLRPETTAETTQPQDTVEQPTSTDIIDLSDVGITAVSIPYARREFVAEGQPLRTVSGNSQIIVYNDRPIVIATINGINVPFYRSTGKGGKADVQADKWYPFFGIGSDGWINKTSGNTGINDYYGSDALRQMAEALDTNITEDMIATARSQSSVGTPATSQATYDLINQVFPNAPTDNGKADTLKTVEANIAYIVNALGGSTQTTTEQQVLLLGYQSVEQAQNELVPLVNNYQVQTVEQVQELTNVLATTMGVPVSEVKQYLLDSQLVDDTFTGDITDMVYDEANNIWTIADTQTERQGLPYANEQAETNERPRTQAIGSTNYRQISFSEPSTTPTPEATAGTSEVTAGTSEVTTADGITFNLQEILSGVTNKRIRRGEVPPTLNDLAPEDDTADRPTIELTINGQTHTGKLYRFRKGNRRFIAFVHDGNAYGMKAVQNGVENQDWINFGAGVGTKRVDSINAQTAINIRVLDGTPTQQDLFNQPQEQNAPPVQETENETQQTGRVEDGNQSADTRTQDENGTDTVGGNPRADVIQREVSSESGRGDGTGSQASGNETTDGPMGDTQAENDGNQTQSVQVTPYPSNLTRQERNAIAEVAQFEGVPVDTVYQAIAVGNISFFTGTGATRGADVSVMARELVNQDIADNVAKAENLISRLTTAPVTKENTPSGNSLVDDYFAQNPKDKAEIENYLVRTRRALEQAVNAELDKQADYADRNDFKRAEQAYEQAAQYQQELKALPANAVEMVNAYLTDGVALKDAVSQAVRSTRPAANGFTFDSLPQGIKDILNKIWNSLKNTVAAVSMAIAVYAGSSFVVPNEAMAATPVETATVQHIVQTNDNQGKSFIVADKQAGTLTVYNAAGQELTSTPALFGKNVGDSITAKNTTPSGRYDLTRATNINNSAYGNSAQVLTVNGQMQTNNAGNLAIHRVLTSFPSENRVGRLDSATASDNRISHGCINVPASFYDAHLDNVGDAVVYVLPETDAGRTGVFNVNVPTTVTTVTTVEPQMDNANAKSVEVKPSDIQSAPATYGEPKQAPVKALAPVTIAGTQPSGQVAYVAPVVVGGITADQINVPFDVHTPAELQANGVYDTEPVSGSLRSDGGNGFNIYEIAAWLAGIGATAKVISKRRKKKLASKKGNEQPTAGNANEETVTSEQNPSGTDRNEQAQATVDDNHNDKVNKSADHVITNAQAPSQKTQIADAVTRAMWLEYIANSHLTIAKDENGNMVEGGDIYSAFVDSMLGFEWAIDDVMRDRTIEQANDDTFADPLKWRNEISEKGRAGISAKLMNWAAGVTQAFDNLMTEHGIARVGHEMDSSIPSKHLAQIKAKASGAYAQIHKLYVKPLVLKVDILAGNLRTSYTKLEHDIGRVATVKHVLNEAADAMWRGREHIIRTHQEQLVAVNQAIDNTAEGNEVRLTLTNKARLLQKEIKEQTELLNKARDMYNGVIPWDGKTGMPGGYTKAQAEKVLADLKAKYGSNFSQVEQLATETVQTIRGIRNFAAAAGVFSNADLQTFYDLGFTEYVPLYAEQKDPLEVDETNAYTKQSIMDKLMADLPAQEARAMGLTKDLSRYHREGATSPAADAFTNMKVFSMNMAGRVGQQGWLNSVQQLYEGTVGKPISATGITDEALLKELNASPDSGKLPGLIRVRPGMEQFVGIDTSKLKPIVAKGHNSHGEVVTYHYYFTEPAIQAEIYSNSDLTETLAAKGLRNVGTLTRLAARMMTTFKPVWNVYNWARDSLERISIMLMRPVKDKDGNLVNKWDLSKAYFKNLAALASSPTAQSEIYRYLVLGETQTKLQKILHEAVGEGAINLMTSQTEKHSIMADLNKSTIDKLLSQAAAMLGEGFNKAGAGKIKRGADQLVDMYVMRLTEVPQITTALSAYMAYQDVGVNKGETANRVRDQYDPTRANNKAINSASQLFPFIRSTFSGHYNLARTLSEYWKPGTWQAPLAYMVVGTLGTMAVLTMRSAMFGDDEDGVPKIARLPIGSLMNGIPVPTGDGGVWSLPVGFGMNKLAWGIGANLWRQSMGMQTGGDTAKQLLGLVADNTSPIQFASGNIMAENPVTGMALTFTPLLAKPLMEIATNTKAFGGAKIINRETPKDQYDSDQDNFNTPETYKTWVRALRETTGIDMRPETMRHLVESYSWGPLGAVPKSVIQDQSDKTLGNVQRKGEVFGPLMTAIGADMAIQPNALDYAQHTYAMQDLRMELHKRYGVGETHSDEVYEQYADRGKRGGVIKRADVVTERAMRDKGVPEHVIQYVVNGMRFNKARQEANKNFTELSQKYYELRQQGKDDPVMRMAVQSAWDELEDLTYNFVKENNRAYFEIMQQQ